MNRLIGALLVIILILGILWLLPKALPGAVQAVTGANPVTRAVSMECYVGVSSEHASITVSGVAAGAVCDQIVSSDKRLFRMSQAPTERVMCERDYKGFHYTVRDQGLLNIIGNQLCTKVQAFQ